MDAVPRLVRIGKAGIDLALLAGVYGLTFALRFEGQVPPEYVTVLAATLPAVLVVKLVWLLTFGVPRMAWRYVSLREAERIGLALFLASVTLVAWRLTAGSLDRLPWVPAHAPLPLGVLAIDLFLSFLALLGVRAAFRLWVEGSERRRFRGDAPAQVPTVLIGAGRVGVLVAKEMAARSDNSIHAVGFLDDDPRKVGTVVHGLTVLGNSYLLGEVVRRHGVKQVLITLVDTTGDAVRRLAKLCEEVGVPAKVIPGIHEIVEGKVNLARLRDVAIEDVMKRAPVQLDAGAIAELIQGQTVLISGAGGSIGAELCRVVCGFAPRAVVLVEKTENSLFHINRELAGKFPAVPVAPCLSDVCDRAKMEQLFARHRPAVVLHAAAHKHVPLMEAHPEEAVKNNVVGTRTLADVAHEHGVGVFVMISTDKAVRPSSVMGVSKRVAELYIQALSQRSPTRFVAVRFGNVLGSAGSVVPIFKEQIARGGPVTVTHPEMSRYFMTIPEACQLVLQAASMGRGGEIFILDMGEPMKIVDLARDLIRLSGLQPDRDIEVRFTGIRPGEKLFEELALQEESADKTQHPRIYIGRLQTRDWEEINRRVQELADLPRGTDGKRFRAKFQEIVPEYEGLGPRVRLDPAHERGGPKSGDLQEANA